MAIFAPSTCTFEPISDAICKLLDDQDKAKQMGLASRGWVIDNLQMKNCSEKFNKLLLSN